MISMTHEVSMQVLTHWRDDSVLSQTSYQRSCTHTHRHTICLFITDFAILHVIDLHIVSIQGPSLIFMPEIRKGMWVILLGQVFLGYMSLHGSGFHSAQEHLLLWLQNQGYVI